MPDAGHPDPMIPTFSDEPDAPFLVGDLDPASLLAAAVDGPVLVDNDVNWAARAELLNEAVLGAVIRADGGRFVTVTGTIARVRFPSLSVT